MRSTVLLVAFSTLSVLACGGDDTTGPQTGNGTATVASVVVTPVNATLVSLGETVQLTASARDASGNTISGKTFTWSSSDQTIATVNSTGLVTAVANGAATITATTDGVSGTATIDAMIAPVAIGFWVGFTSQDRTISFRVTDQDVIEQLGVRIQASLFGGTCTANFAPAENVPVTDAAFVASLTNQFFVGLSTTVQGSFSSSSRASGSVDGYDGTFSVLCGSSLFAGTGSLWSDQTWEASPLVPTSVEIEFASVNPGGLYTCGVTTAGAAYCWGKNDFGQVGDGSNVERDTPVPVAGGLTFASVDAGGNHTCGLTTSGVAYCWGRNASDGLLGNGSTASSDVPVPVAGGLTFASISVENTHTCGVTTSGAAYCWGNGFYGNLGNGSTADSDVPVPVAGGLTFASVDAGGFHTCGLTPSGAAYCWGDGFDGALGNGSTTDSDVPVAVAGGLTFASVDAGLRYACGITTAGVAYCWGTNDRGQVGDGSKVERHAPVLVQGSISFASISAGDEHTCGVVTSGPTYCWGSNNDGKLGIALPGGSFNVPTSVFGELEFVSVTAWLFHTCGVTVDNVAYCWGRNSFGQLGLGTSSGAAEVPMPVTPRSE